MTNAAKTQVLDALSKWVRQRPGLEYGNYGNLANYRAELRSIGKDLRDAETLIAAVRWRDSITAETIIEAAKHAYSGRLTIRACFHGANAKATCGICKRSWCSECDPAPSALCHWCHGRGHSDAKHGAVTIDYCTGQYWPTEYRRAVCAVLASVLWSYWRADMPEPFKVYGTNQDWYAWKETSASLPKPVSAGDYLRKTARREFGRSIAQRWFS